MATESQLENPFVEQLMEELEKRIPIMDHGTVFTLDESDRFGNPKNQFVAVLSCPKCGYHAYITLRQLFQGEKMICSSDLCSAEYHLDGETFAFHKPQ